MKGQHAMFRLIKILFYLAIVLVVAVIGFAYLGDLTPDRNDVVEPVEINAG